MSKFKERIKKIPFFAIISFVMLLLYGVSLFLPLLWAIITSFKTNFNYLLDSFGWPTEFVNNYVTVFKYFTVPIKDSTGFIYYVGITEMVVNSIWYALGSALLSTTAAFLVGYVVARFRFKFCHIIYTVIIIQMIVPTVGTLPSELRIAHALGLYDTVFGALFMKTYVSGLYFLSFYSALRVIPKDYAEAAKLDGAGNFHIMVLIFFPMAKGVFFTIVLLNFIAFWNDYQTPMIYIPSYPTLAYGLYYYVSGSFEQETSSVPMRLAGCVMVAIPLFIIFIAFQKKLLGGVSMGGLK